jgi:hypothetical protein
MMTLNNVDHLLLNKLCSEECEGAGLGLMDGTGSAIDAWQHAGDDS